MPLDDRFTDVSDQVPEGWIWRACRSCEKPFFTSQQGLRHFFDRDLSAPRRCARCRRLKRRADTIVTTEYRAEST
jgi:hypothetical protein